MKTISLGQFAEASGKVLHCLSLLTDGDALQRWIDDPDRDIELTGGEEKKQSPAALSYPALGVEFDLTIAEPFTGIEMVRRFGYDPTGWKFNGEEIAMPQTKQFKLVSVGAQPNFKKVEAANAKEGVIPDGQWCDAFKKAFPQPDGNGPIGVAKASWVRPGGYASFPYVRTGGGLSFLWIDDVFYADWRWLVEVQA